MAAAEAVAPQDVAAPGDGAATAPRTLRSRAWTALKWLGDAAYTHWFILGLAFFIGLAAAVPQARPARNGGVTA